MARMEGGGGQAWDLRMVAAIGAVLLVVGLAALLWLDPHRAGQLVDEDGPVEWVQAGFLFAGWVVATACAVRRLARGQPAVAELLLVALLTIGITVELSLHTGWASASVTGDSRSGAAPGRSSPGSSWQSAWSAAW